MYHSSRPLVVSQNCTRSKFVRVLTAKKGWLSSTNFNKFFKAKFFFLITGMIFFIIRSVKKQKQKEQEISP